MKFCSNCGKQLDDDAVFCNNCGTNVGTATAAANPAPDSGTTVSNAQPTGGVYNAGTGNAPGNGVAPCTGNAPGYNVQQPAAPYNQAAPNYQQPYGGQAPYGAPYGGTPPYGTPPKKNSNKAVIIIIAVVLALALITVGVVIWSKLSQNEPVPAQPQITFQPSEEPAPSEESVINPSSEPSADFNIFDSATAQNVIAAMEEIGIDTAQVTGLQEFGNWNEGTIYAFDYEDSVFDMLLYDDGTVFSIETGGTQLYIKGYESYNVNDYLGSTTHFNEAYPDNGYVFYLTDTEVTSTLVVQTSSDMDYIVELIDANTGSLVEAYYIQAGQNWSMAVPEGDYQIQYAAGTWQDYENMFSDSAYYYRSDNVYTISPDSETDLTLDPLGGTGIASTQITSSDFFGS
jgi:hypothetical protein